MLIYFVNALTWAGEPMARARLGSIVPLQMCFTPRQIESCLERWCTMLRGHGAAACAMSAVVREALYRDIIGFIPVYSGVFMFGLWYGYSQLQWSWLSTHVRPKPISYFFSSAVFCPPCSRMARVALVGAPSALNWNS